MRGFMAAIIVTVLFGAFGLRAESSKPADTRNYHALQTIDLIALNEGRPIEAAADPTGLPVELLFVPTQLVRAGGRLVLRDEITGLTCAAQPKVLDRLGQFGDDFLVVRGVLGRADAGRGREIGACSVVGWDGVVWEESRAIEAEKQRDLYRAGRL